MKKLSNLTVAEFRQALMVLGLHPQKTKGGHEAWMKKGMTRPAIVQTHIEPVPEFIVKNAIRDIGITRQEFMDVLEKL